jgi:SAM-dependent methyltransferase
MTSWHNESGRPLSSNSWLKAHHNAKITERKEFAKSLINDEISTIVDLGCGLGLWLELFDAIAPRDCKLIGIDSDKNVIKSIHAESKDWQHKTEFITLDLTTEAIDIPECDLILAFNIFPYLKDPVKLLNCVKNKLRPGGKLVVRQYDGAALRFGPIPHDVRLEIDGSLYASVGHSEAFYHYDLDRVFTLLKSSNFENVEIEFELFQKTSPYTSEFYEYYKNTVSWTLDYLSETAAEKLLKWKQNHLGGASNKQSYFTEVDLVAVLS